VPHLVTGHSTVVPAAASIAAGEPLAGALTSDEPEEFGPHATADHTIAMSANSLVTCEFRIVRPF